jgi:hypothetical protein
MYENGIASLDAIGLASQKIRRNAFVDHCRRSLVIDVIGQRDQPVGR